MLLAASASLAGFGQEQPLDLSKAIILHSGGAPRQRTAAEFLQYEIGQRTGIQLAISDFLPAEALPVIALGAVGAFPTSLTAPTGFSVPDKAEGYSIWVDKHYARRPTVCLMGRDDRGTLFGIGCLLRC